MISKKYIVIIFLTMIFASLSCKKDWLEAKPELSLVVPLTIADFQALLDNTTSTSAVPFNIRENTIPEISSGDFYVSDASWNSVSPVEQNSYTWEDNIYGTDQTSNEWNVPYQRIFYTNVVLEGIEDISPKTLNEQTAWRNVKGAALFFRAYNHYMIAKQFCKAFEASTAGQESGIPLRLVSDFNIKVPRSSIEETYKQIIGDLKNSIELLPVSKPTSNSNVYRTRPNIAGAHAMLARVYLSMGIYDSAFFHANGCLNLYDELLDYNTVIVSATRAAAFDRFNPEVIFHMVGNPYAILSQSNLIVDSNLHRSYQTDDLRRTLFFRFNGGQYRFRGTYDGSASSFFTGLATDEIYLIRAECHARKGNVSEAMNDLNSLMQKRWKSSTWTEIDAVDANDALSKILIERQKELCFRGLKWSDLRRLNKIPQFARQLTRTINGQTYTLAPNHNKYMFPIPPDVIQLGGIQQNPR